MAKTNKKKKNPNKKNKPIAFNPKYLRNVIIVELLFIAALLIIFPYVTSWYSDDPARLSDSAVTDEISASSGKLIVNNVTVSIPDTGNVKYDISYSWSEDDKDYPSIPRAITASYLRSAVSTSTDNSSSGEAAKDDSAGIKADENAADKTDNTREDAKADAAAQDEAVDSDANVADTAEDDKPLYDISLYRNSYTESSRVPAGKDIDNWFDDWTEQDNEESTQTKLSAGNINGFCVSTIKQAGENGLGDGSFGTYSFYFASPLNKGIAVYVIEGICYDKASAAEMQKTLEDSINSIKISKDKISNKKDA